MSPERAQRVRASSGGRRQLSVEKAKTVSAGTPHLQQHCTVVRSAAAPRRCPSAAGSPRAVAHRVLPSITIATWPGSLAASRPAAAAAAAAAAACGAAGAATGAAAVAAAAPSAAEGGGGARPAPGWEACGGGCCARAARRAAGGGAARRVLADSAALRTANAMSLHCAPSRPRLHPGRAPERERRVLPRQHAERHNAKS